MAPEIVAFIRDIAIIVMAVMVTVAAATLTALALKTYPTVRRAARNFEASSRLALETAARVAGLVSVGSQLGMFISELISRFRSRNDAEPPPQDNETEQRT